MGYMCVNAQTALPGFVRTSTLERHWLVTLIVRFDVMAVTAS
jgi:hypothetical protein